LKAEVFPVSHLDEMPGPKAPFIVKFFPLLLLLAIVAALAF